MTIKYFEKDLRSVILCKNIDVRGTTLPLDLKGNKMTERSPRSTSTELF